ncbi:MAG: hypothetical protein GX102_03335 [Porphyromonadaceae bacterium]|jgi:YD repeat-containing protein|nr:hypothetical protein [Porphyromonadaceae bacterium]
MRWRIGLEYRDLKSEDIEFYYDANGNLVADLDRDFVTIRYNILNLPGLIQFKNGYQIPSSRKCLISEQIVTLVPVRRDRQAGFVIPPKNTMRIFNPDYKSL